ncbi:ribosomal protein S10 [Martensiomyces pterosporus]|nr:ribosomal protein S10 [Martensiomyces pterosporus]
MLRSAASRAVALRSAPKPAFVQATTIKAASAMVSSPGSSVRMASTYASILDKVLGVDVRQKTKMIPLEDVDPIYQKPKILPSPHGVRVCKVAFRSFQLQRLDFYMTFCRKAAQHMGIPCTGAVRLPRVIRRWTVLKSPFVHKSAMEVFERRTYKRVMVIKDADPEVVKKWLEYIAKNIPAGLGMKYWLTEYESMEIGGQIERNLETRDPRKIGEMDLGIAKRAETVVQRGRRRLWTTYKDLPVYGREDVEKLALDVASQLRVSPKSNIEEVTRSVVMGTRPPKEVTAKDKAKARAKATAGKPANN